MPHYRTLLIVLVSLAVLAGCNPHQNELDRLTGSSYTVPDWIAGRNDRSLMLYQNDVETYQSFLSYWDDKEIMLFALDTFVIADDLELRAIWVEPHRNDKHSLLLVSANKEEIIDACEVVYGFGEEGIEGDLVTVIRPGRAKDELAQLSVVETLEHYLPEDNNKVRTIVDTKKREVSLKVDGHFEVTSEKTSSKEWMN